MTAKIPPKPAAKPSKDVIYVDVDDEITGIIDKLENSSHKVVALVLPKRATSLQSIVNMKLLSRSAESAGKSPVLITSEAALLPLAGAAGLHVAKNLQSKPEVPDAPVGRAHVPAKKADEPEEVEDDSSDNEMDDEANLPEKIDYASPVGALAAAHEDESDAAIDLGDDAGDDDTSAPKAPKKSKNKDKKLKVPNFDRFRMLLGLGVLGIVALIVFIIFAITVLPKAKITIQTASESVSANFAVDASADTTAVDAAKNKLPAKLETMDQTGTQQVTATGSQNTGDKAAGTVSMTAKECAPSLGTPDDVPSGSGISSGGVSFITQARTSFALASAAGSCVNYTATSPTPVKAVAPGAKYNISSGSFSVRSDITASGSTTGGTDNIATVLSQADVDGATTKLTAGTTATTFTKTFEDKLAAQGEYVLTTTMKAGDPVINATPAVGQPASTANVTIKITYTVLALKKTDLSQIIEAKMGDQIDSKKQKLTGNFLNDANIAVQSQGAPNSAQISINEDTTAVPIISVDAVKQQAKGKKTGDIQAAIGNWPGVKDVNVSLGPFWVSKVPTKTSKITVVLQEVKDSSSDSKP